MSHIPALLSVDPPIDQWFAQLCQSVSILMCDYLHVGVPEFTHLLLIESPVYIDKHIDAVLFIR